MARTEQEILKNIADNIKDRDSSVDTTKGPLYNFVMAPVAPVVRDVELASDRVERLLSLDIVAADNNSADIEAFGNNFRVPRGGGQKERHLQTFYLFSKPTHVIEIPTGTLVSTEQGTYTYRVIQGSFFSPDTSENYYNSDTARYEISLMVEAIGYGSAYNVPVGRVNKLVTSIQVDGTVSTSESLVPGTEVETDQDYMTKVEQRFLGLNSGTVSGIKYQINEALGIDDVNVFKPGDDVFKRLVKRAAFDVYVNRFNEKACVQSFQIDYTTDTIKLNQSPVKRVNSVLVDNESVEFEFFPDTNVETAGSNHSNDYIKLFKEVESGSYVTINYNINGDVDAAASLFNEKDLYDSDVFIREPFVVNLNLKVLIKTNTIVDADAIAEAREAIAGFPTYKMGEVLYVKDLENAIRRNVPNISDVYIVQYNIDGQEEMVTTVDLPDNCVINVTNNAIVRVL